MTYLARTTPSPRSQLLLAKTIPPVFSISQLSSFPVRLDFSRPPLGILINSGIVLDFFSPVFTMHVFLDASVISWPLLHLPGLATSFEVWPGSRDTCTLVLRSGSHQWVCSLSLTPRLGLSGIDRGVQFSQMHPWVPRLHPTPIIQSSLYSILRILIPWLSVSHTCTTSQHGRVESVFFILGALETVCYTLPN